MKTGILQPNGQLMVEPTFDPSIHAGRAVAHMAGLPLDANVTLHMTSHGHQRPSSALRRKAA